MRNGRCGLGLVALGMALLLACNTLIHHRGWFSPERSPGALTREIEPGFDLSLPEGTGPWPTILLFSGCDGPKDNMERWAEAAVSAGWGAMVVDSHGPRGYDEAQIWRLICAGQLLPGAERAGDVAAAVAYARRQPGVDPDRIVLAGFSHGGWAILDMLALHGRDEPPYGLTVWPEGFRHGKIDGILGAILVYPYCGIGSLVSRSGWAADLPLLFLLVEDDQIANEAACLDLVDRMSAAGRETVVEVIPGTTHGFDQAEKSAFSTLEFSPEATAQAKAAIEAFLSEIDS